MDELAKIALAGAGALGSAMAADVWQKIHDGIARMFRRIFLRPQAGGSRASVAASPPEVYSGAPADSGAAVAAARGRCEQVNLAIGGDVFAVQRGNLTLRFPAGRRRAPGGTG
jgi:hypothetical protein